MALKKFSRTYHFNWSLSLQNDDRRLQTLEHMIGKRVIGTEKLDGENTTMYHDAIHARSMDSRHHGSRDWVKAHHGQIKHNIPEGWRVVVENVYAKHSIYYENLLTYAYGIAVFDEHNICLAWDDAVAVFAMLGIVPAPVLFDGIFDEAALRQLAKDQDPNLIEGYVVRVADAFHDDDYLTHVGKYVRAKHVQTDVHWMQADIVPNKLCESIGFFKHLSPEQQKAALEYLGPDF